MSSLWDDPFIQQSIKMMDEETRKKYAAWGEKMYQKGGVIDAIEANGNPESQEHECAAQLMLMLRDGLDPSELAPNEKELLMLVFGEEEMKSHGVVQEMFSFPNENEQTIGGGVCPNSSENQGSKKDFDGNERRRKKDCDRTSGLSQSNRGNWNSHRRKNRNYSDTKRQKNQSNEKGIQKISGGIVQ